MFWILEIFPNWLWWLLLLAGLVVFFLAPLIPVKTYQLPAKIIGGVVVCIVIFTMGLLYANGVWQQAAQELQTKVQVAEAESETANAQIETKVVTRTQVVKQRGETVIRYIDRETVKIDERCTIPPEFVNAHNQAATK
jgi:hypothetical protein